MKLVKVSSRDGSLVINDVSRADMGWFRCVVEKKVQERMDRRMDEKAEGGMDRRMDEEMGGRNGIEQAVSGIGSGMERKMEKEGDEVVGVEGFEGNKIFVNVTR